MKANEQNLSRIPYLDGLRCLAVAAVVLFHYFSRWTPPLNPSSLYPYGSAFAALFQYGLYGVQLFFIVSGFVIALTLYRCSTFLEFAIRRLARLWPSMFLCSLLTLIIISIVPNHALYSSTAGLLPSLTFLDPLIFNRMLHTHIFDWIDAAYWSLFVEVRFYFFAGLLFFWRRESFPETMTYFSFTVMTLMLLASIFNLAKIAFLLSFFFIADTIPWFLIGIALYLHFKGSKTRLPYMQFGGAILYLAGMGIIQHSYPLTMVAIVIPSIFLAGVYFAPFRWVLSQRLITAIGAASYSFYLLHQYIGVTLIHFLSGTLHLEGKLSALVAIVITIAVASVARLIYVYWEHPINRYIVDRLCGKPSYLQQHAGRSAFSSIPVPPREVIRKVELSE